MPTGAKAKYTEFGKQSQHASRFEISTTGKHPTIKAKDLIELSWMLAFALRKDSWCLRLDIIWHKPSPMPESTKDRCTKSHEYIFLLSKTTRYYFDQEAIKNSLKDESILRLMQEVELQKGCDRVPGKTNGTIKVTASGRKPRPGIDSKGGRQAKGHISMAKDGWSLGVF